MSLLTDYSQVVGVDDEPEAKIIPIAEEGAEERLRQAINSIKHERVLMPLKLTWHEHVDAYYDNSPLQPFMVMPALIPYGSMGIIAGAPKVGKTDFMLNMFSHFASGEDFMMMQPLRPLRIAYIQCEVNYNTFRLRLRHAGIPESVLQRGRGNFKFTDRFEAILNPENLELAAQAVLEMFCGALPDIIAIDPLRNVFDPGQHQGENSNDGMMYFLRNIKSLLRDRVNPNASLLFAHHTRKQNSQEKSKAHGDVFDLVSGASAFRGAHDYLLVLTLQDPKDPENPVRICDIESRNAVREMLGMTPPARFSYKKENGVYRQVDAPIVTEDAKTLNFRQDREQKNEVILNYIYEEAKNNARLYTREALIKSLEDKFGLGSASTIRTRVDILMQKWKIKLTAEAYQHGDFKQSSRPAEMYLVVYDMVMPDMRIVLPTHCKSRMDNTFDFINDNRIWQLND